MNSLDFIDATTQTVRGAAQYLARNGAKVGLTGFCLGGAVTIIGAAKIPELTAGVVFYGIPPEQAAKPADIKIPLQAHFANKDDWCTPSAVDAFEKAMKSAGKSLELSAMTPSTPSSTSSACRCTTAPRRNSPGAGRSGFSKSIWGEMQPRFTRVVPARGRSDEQSVFDFAKQRALWFGSLRSQDDGFCSPQALIRPVHPIPPRARPRHQLKIPLHHLHRRAQAARCGVHAHLARDDAVFRRQPDALMPPQARAVMHLDRVASSQDRSRGRPSRIRS